MGSASSGLWGTVSRKSLKPMLAKFRLMGKPTCHLYGIAPYNEGQNAKNVFSQNGAISISIDNIPDNCPVCLHAANPVDIGIGFQRNDNKLELVFRCPRLNCG